MTSGRPAFQQHVKRAESSDTTPRLAHTENHERRMYNSRFRQKRKRSRSPAGPRRLRDSDTHKRIAVPQASCVLLAYTRPRPKSGKVCRSDTRPGDVCERAERFEGSDTTPTSHVQKVLRTERKNSNITKLQKDHAAQRGRGASEQRRA